MLDRFIKKIPPNFIKKIPPFIQYLFNKYPHLPSKYYESFGVLNF